MEGRQRLFPTARLQLLRVRLVRSAARTSHLHPLSLKLNPATHRPNLATGQDLFFAEWQIRTQRLGEQLYPIFYPEVR